MKPSFDHDAFFAALNAERVSRGLTWKEVAEQSGIQASTITRMSQGKKPDVNGLTALLAWSNLKAEMFMRGVAQEEAKPLARMAAMIHMDPSLTFNSAKLMEDIMLTTYQRLRRDP